MDKKRKSDEAKESSITQAKELAEFIEKMSGGLISNGLGLINDRLAYLRLKQAVSLRDKVNTLLMSRGVKHTRDVFPKVLVPLLQSATIEEDEDLHTRYATLLTNALDPRYRGRVSRNFVSILDDMEPIDVLVLDKSHDDVIGDFDNLLISIDKMTEKLGRARSEIAVSVRNLIRLGLLKPGVVVSSSVAFGQHPMTSYKDIELYGLTELGIEFVAATRPDDGPLV